MKKGIYKYPYNASIKEETKIFLSDQIYEQVISITYRNGQILCTDKKKKIVVSVGLTFGALFGMPKESRPIGVPPILPSLPEIHRSTPKDFHQHDPVIPRLDKISLTIKQCNSLSIRSRELPVCIYMIDKKFLSTPEINERIKKLRGGSQIEAAAALIMIVLMLQIMGVGIEGFQIPIIHPNGVVHRPANGKV